MSIGFLLRVAGLVLFILAALFFFGVGGIKLSTSLGLVASGLACWLASTVDWPAVPARP
jgi:hypothetical protein